MSITLGELLALLSGLTLGQILVVGIVILVVNVIFYAVEHWKD